MEVFLEGHGDEGTRASARICCNGPPQCGGFSPADQ